MISKIKGSSAFAGCFLVVVFFVLFCDKLLYYLKTNTRGWYLHRKAAHELSDRERGFEEVLLHCPVDSSGSFFVLYRVQSLTDLQKWKKCTFLHYTLEG